MTEVPLIVQVIHRYHPDWEPPDGSKTWQSTRCPFHGDESPSASVSFDHNAFRCFACGVKGDAIAIIRQQEEVTFAEAVGITENLAPGGYRAVSSRNARKPRRRVFGDSGAGMGVDQTRGRSVHARVRGRPSPWS